VQTAPLDSQSNIKIERATEGLKKCFIARLENHENKTNALTIASFLIVAKIESNIAISYKEDLIFTLCKLSNYVSKDFNNFTREDILSYLDSYRKTEAKDPLHSWIGSYNLHRVFIMKFFRWFYSPDMEPKDRANPSCIENIPTVEKKRKECLQTY
jgi:site-specific recombinase XerD